MVNMKKGQQKSERLLDLLGIPYTIITNREGKQSILLHDAKPKKPKEEKVKYQLLKFIKTKL